MRERPSTLPGDALAHLDSLYRMAVRLTGSPDEAQDLVQDTYARALGAGARSSPGENVRAWLFCILRNLHVDAWRRRRANPVSERLDDDDPPGGSATSEPLRGDEELERLRGVVQADIEAALRALSIDARTIILLDLEDLTQDEVAEVMGCEVGTVKSRLSRARARLRELLRDYAR